MKKINILFTSVGRRVVLLKLFKEALTDLGNKGKIIAADASENSAARYVADLHFTIPKVGAANYLQALLSICKEYEIGILIPLIDTELPILAPNKELFRTVGTEVLISSAETIKIGRDKRDTSKFFLANNFDTPKILEPQAILDSNNTNFPYFIKPADGSSSIGAFKVNNKDELHFFVNYVTNPILQEFVSGEEYTLDILADFSGEVKSVVPRLRMATRAGEISKGITIKNSTLINKGKALVEALPGSLGCITVQGFLTSDHKVNFIEINPRFGGGFPLSCEAGANFPLWILKMFLKQDIDIKIDAWEEGVKMLRYDDAIYLRTH